MNALDLKTLDSNIYILRGSDTYLLDRAISFFKNSVGADGLSFRRLDENVTLGRVLEETTMGNFFGDKTVVLVDGLAKLAKDDEAKLVDYAKNPSPTSVLVCLAGGGETYKCIDKYSEVVLCDALRGAELNEWIKSVCTGEGRRIENSALHNLVSSCADNMAVIVGELQKLFSYCEGDIFLEDVEVCVCVSVERQVFELSNAFAKRDNKKALSVLNELLIRGEEPVALFGLIQKHYSRLLHCAVSNMSASELSEFFKVKPYAVEMLKKSIGGHGGYSVREIKTIADMLTEYEFKFKSGKMLPRQALLEVASQIISKNRR